MGHWATSDGGNWNGPYARRLGNLFTSNTPRHFFDLLPNAIKDTKENLIKSIELINQYAQTRSILMDHNMKLVMIRPEFVSLADQMIKEYDLDKVCLPKTLKFIKEILEE